MIYVIVGMFLGFTVILTHYYLSGMRKENERLKRENDLAKAERRGRELRGMPIDKLIEHANESRVKRRGTEGGS